MDSFTGLFQEPLFVLFVFSLLLAVFARGFRWLLAVYSACIFYIWLLGGSNLFLQPLLALALGLYISAVVFWRFGYILAACGTAAASVGYVAAGQPLDVLSPYFGYLALLAWLGWRLGGGRFSYLVGTASLLVQSIVLLFDSPFGKWPGAPVLSLVFLPLIFSAPREPSNGGRPALLATGLATLGFVWGCLRLFLGSVGEFVGGSYLLYLLLISVVATSLAASPRRFLGGLLIAAGVYLLVSVFVPPRLSTLLALVLPPAVLFTTSLAKWRVVVPAVVLAGGALAVIYFSPLIVQPPYTVSAVVGPLSLNPDGSTTNSSKSFLSVLGGRFGVEGFEGRGVFDVRLGELGTYPVVVDVDFLWGRVEPYVLEIYAYPHIAVARVYVLDDLFESFQLCRLSASLGVGCEGIRLSLGADVKVYPGVLLFVTLWLLVLLTPLAFIYIKCTRFIRMHIKIFK